MTARTTAACVKPIEMPSASKVPPRSPSRPKAARSAIPATAGGRTSGSSTSVTTNGSAAEARAGDQVGGGRTDHENQRLRDHVRLQSDDDGVECNLAPELGEELSGRDAQEDRDERKEQEDERDRRREGERGREEPTPAHRSTITEVDLTTRGRRASGLQVEFLGRLAGDDCDDARRRGHVELDAGEKAVDLDGSHDAAKAVAGAQLLRSSVPAAGSPPRRERAGGLPCRAPSESGRRDPSGAACRG